VCNHLALILQHLQSPLSLRPQDDSQLHELPDGVDYIAVGRQGSPPTYGHSMVPVMSSISLTLNVMYSRREMAAHSVDNWMTGSLRGRGYI